MEIVKIKTGTKGGDGKETMKAETTKKEIIIIMEEMMAVNTFIGGGEGGRREEVKEVASGLLCALWEGGTFIKALPCYLSRNPFGHSKGENREGGRGTREEVQGVGQCIPIIFIFQIYFFFFRLTSLHY